MVSMTHLAGGLLSGVGRGMVAQAEDATLMKRDRMLMELRRQADAEDRAFRREEATEDRKFRQGLLADEQAARLELEEKRTESERGLLGQRQGFERAEAERERTFRASEARTAREHELGVERIKARGRESGSDLTDAKRAWDIAVEGNSTVDDMTGAEQIDYGGVAEYLRGRGFTQEAAVAERTAERIATAAQEGDALAQAQAEADARKGIFKTRGSEFPETGGDESEWVRRRAQQISAGMNSSTPQGAGGTVEAAGMPQPSSKAEFDALPSGTRFIDPEGKVRVKP